LKDTDDTALGKRRPLVFPPPGSGIRFVVEPPGGVDTIFAIAAKDRRSLLRALDSVKTGKRRGVRVEQTAPPVSFSTLQIEIRP